MQKTEFDSLEESGHIVMNRDVMFHCFHYGIRVYTRWLTWLSHIMQAGYKRDFARICARRFLLAHMGIRDRNNGTGMNHIKVCSFVPYVVLQYVWV